MSLLVIFTIIGVIYILLKKNVYLLGTRFTFFQNSAFFLTLVLIAFLFIGYLLALLNILNIDNYFLVTALATLLAILFLPKFQNKKLKLYSLQDIIVVLINVILLFFLMFNHSFWFAPVQNDSNSYALTGYLTYKNEGLNWQQPDNSTSIERIFPSTFQNDTGEYQRFGMPWYLTISAIGIMLFGIYNLWFLPYIFMFLASVLMSILIRNFSNKKNSILITTIYMLSPVTVLMYNKLFNENFTLLLILFYLVSVLVVKSKRKLLELAIVSLLPLIRIELILFFALWVAVQLVLKNYRLFLTGILLFVVNIIHMFILNPQYLQRDVLDRANNFLSGFGIEVNLFVLLLFCVLLSATSVFIILLSKRLIKIYPYLAAIGLFMFMGFMLFRSFDYYNAANSSTDITTIALYSKEHANMDQIIISRLGIISSSIIAFVGYFGVILLVMRKKSLGLIPVLFFVMLFLFTAQHDPNIIPWSRRYIYLVLPILFIGFSYIFDGLPKRLNIISSIALLTFSLVSFYPSASLVMNKAEYADTEGFIQLIESSIPAGSRIIIDSKNDQSVVQNLRFCETFEIVLDLQCDYSIKEVEILDTSRFDYYVTMENLLDYRLYLSAKYRLDLVSYPVEYYEWPDDVRSAVFDVLVYKT